jgi:hypothetical protein
MVDYQCGKEIRAILAKTEIKILAEPPQIWHMLPSVEQAMIVDKENSNTLWW